MEKPFDRTIWENLEPISKSIESLILSIENNIGKSDYRGSAIQKLNDAYQDIVKACRLDQDYRDREAKG